RPSLRIAFEALAREARAQAAVEGRAMPQDDEAFAIVEGVLRQDGEPTAAGAALSIDVNGIVPVFHAGEKGVRPLFGGVIATVVGTLTAERLDRWRAGRRVRVPIQLHRPARYLDPGV